MTMEALFNNVENAISKYKWICQQEEDLYETIREAEGDARWYNHQASMAENASDQLAAQKAVLMQMKMAELVKMFFDRLKDRTPHGMRPLFYSIFARKS